MIAEDEDDENHTADMAPAGDVAAATSSTTSTFASASASRDNNIESADNESAAAVVLRLRPTGRSEVSDFSIERNVFKHRMPVGTDCNQIKVPEKHFTFSHIFPESTTQSCVYDTCVHDAIQNDENLTVLTYGTSGSGKTFTLLGIHSDNPGIIPRAIEHIFQRHGRNVCQMPAVKVVHGNVALVPDDRLRSEAALRRAIIGRGTADVGSNSTGSTAPLDDRIASVYAKQQQCIRMEHDFVGSENEDQSVFVWVSFAEIYNENVFDLLPTPTSSLPKGRLDKHRNTNKSNNNKENQHTAQQQPQHSNQRKTLKVISNVGNAFIKDLNAVHCRSADDAYRLLSAGLNNITYASTNINSHSSRSHCIFFVDVIMNKNQFEFEHVSYKFCDLAGSERLKKTDNVGNRLKEAQSINNSLMVLGRCLDAVYHKQNIVPIRDSKLTVLLQASLLGREKIKMIVNLMPSVEFLEENLNVLNFASMAKQIVYKPPTQSELRKRNRNTARFSWFMSHATSSSSPARNAAAAAIRTENVIVGQTGCTSGAGALNESCPEMGNDTQVSLLLDENDRLKMEMEDALQQIDELRFAAEQRERDIVNMIADHEQHAKRSNERWEKKLQHEKDLFQNELHFQVRRRLH